MSEAIFCKSSKLSVFCIATLLFVLSMPITSHGVDPCCEDIDGACVEIRVNVAANIINITSLEGTDHAVVVHTNQYYFAVDTGGTKIFVNDGNGGDDCEITSFGQRPDFYDNLDISFQLDELKPCTGALEIDYEFNKLRIVGVRKDVDNTTFCGESDMHIVGKQGPGRRP